MGMVARCTDACCTLPLGDAAASGSSSCGSAISPLPGAGLLPAAAFSCSPGAGCAELAGTVAWLGAVFSAASLALRRRPSLRGSCVTSSPCGGAAGTDPKESSKSSIGCLA